MAEQDFDLVYDLVVVGGTAGGLSVAISSQRSGVQSVRLISRSNAVTFPELVRDNQLDIGYGEHVESVDAADDGRSDGLYAEEGREAWRDCARLDVSREGAGDGSREEARSSSVYSAAGASIPSAWRTRPEPGRIGPAGASGWKS